MSSRIFQSVVEQLAQASQKIVGVIDAEGTVISSSDPALSGERYTDAVIAITANPDRLTESGGKCFLTENLL